MAQMIEEHHRPASTRQASASTGGTDRQGGLEHARVL
jgi:hypothetical protein